MTHDDLLTSFAYASYAIKFKQDKTNEKTPWNVRDWKGDATHLFYPKQGHSPIKRTVKVKEVDYIEFQEVKTDTK